jgi:DNA repair photolyase
MLVVCLEPSFPVLILERSPLVVRGLDLLREIDQRAPSIVIFSLISSPDSRTYERVRQMENLAPRMEISTRRWSRSPRPGS